MTRRVLGREIAVFRMGGLTVTLGFMHELLVGESSSKLQHLDAGKTRDRHQLRNRGFFATLADSFKHSLKRDSMCDLFVRIGLNVV